MRLKNKVALITGGAKGIGKACVELAIKEGAKVIIIDIEDKPNFIEELHCEYLQGDVSEESTWQELSKLIKNKHKTLDILLNNAGIIAIDKQDPEHITLEDWNLIHKINLTSVMLGCKYGIKLMKSSDSAAIVNMSSRSGIVGIPTACGYASTKAAIRNHTKSVALYCASMGYKIRCNSLHPGAILTPLWDPMIGQDPSTREKAISEIASGIPLGHMGEAIDVAYAFVYLASEESKYVTGIEINIDGGISAGSSSPPKKYD